MTELLIIIITLSVYFKRLPVVLRKHRDLPFMACRAMAMMQSGAIGMALIVLIQVIK